MRKVQTVIGRRVGVPHDGGWCLGLGDRASASDEECSIDDYESSRLSELKEGNEASYENSTSLHWRDAAVQSSQR